MKKHESMAKASDDKDDLGIVAVDNLDIEDLFGPIQKEEANVVIEPHTIRLNGKTFGAKTTRLLWFIKRALKKYVLMQLKIIKLNKEDKKILNGDYGSESSQSLTDDSSSVKEMKFPKAETFKT